MTLHTMLHKTLHFGCIEVKSHVLFSTFSSGLLLQLMDVGAGGAYQEFQRYPPSFVDTSQVTAALMVNAQPLCVIKSNFS
jgi:hypothetical protein